MNRQEPGPVAQYRATTEQRRALEAFLALKRCAAEVGARLGGFGSLPAGAGLTSSQFDVLEALFQLGTIHQSALRQRQWFSHGNLTMVLGHLERAGWVRRRRRDRDRRFVEVQLTEAGRALVSELLPRQTVAVGAVFSVLSASEQAELVCWCRKLAVSAAGKGFSQDTENKAR